MCPGRGRQEVRAVEGWGWGWEWEWRWGWEWRWPWEWWWGWATRGCAADEGVCEVFPP
ncbi:unnamed protein product [Diplocarpon coronariae]